MASRGAHGRGGGAAVGWVAVTLVVLLLGAAVAFVALGRTTSGTAHPPADTPAALRVPGDATTPAAPVPSRRSTQPAHRSPAKKTTPYLSHAGVPPVSTTPASPSPDGLTARAEAAVRYAGEHGMTSGVAVLDTATGAITTAGNADGYYASASVAKIFIATRLLLTGQMTGDTAALAEKMITQSDNAAAWTLYPRVGRDALLPWLAAHYGLGGIGAPPTMPGIWGSTQISARGLVRFYAAVRHDPSVWPWLSGALHGYAQASSGGEPNAFGIAVAAPSAALKNGWDTNRDVVHPTNAIVDSTGLVQGDRYAVAILSEGPGTLYYAGGEAIVTQEAMLLLPGGRVA
ncbi:MAG: serine hydrolase [Jatrophihabitantaceae bacterium]